jgi:hypothetical protein
MPLVQLRIQFEMIYIQKSLLLLMDGIITKMTNHPFAQFLALASHKSPFVVC